MNTSAKTNSTGKRIIMSVTALFLAVALMFSLAEPAAQAAQSFPTSGAAGFVTRLYRICLSREPDAPGHRSWTDALLARQISGADAARGFFFSAEMGYKRLNDADFMEAMYNVLLGRPSDAPGKADWVNALGSGDYSRERIFDLFAASNEFNNICNSYGIAALDVNKAPPSKEEADVLRSRQLLEGVTVLTAPADLTIERDMFVAHIEKGAQYTEFGLDALDDIMKELERVTGLSFITARQKNKLKVVQTNYNRGAYCLWDGSEIHVGDGVLGGGNEGNISVYVGGLAHEAAHAIFNRNGYRATPFFNEGSANVLDSLVLYNLNLPSPVRSSASRMTYIVPNNDSMLALVNSDFVGLVTSEDYNYVIDGSASYIGERFFTYVYHLYGMSGVIDVLKACSNKNPSQYLKAISDILGVDVTVEFPKWYADNPPAIPDNAIIR